MAWTAVLVSMILIFVVIMIVMSLWAFRSRPGTCHDCGKYPADPPGKVCPGCEAYRAHTGWL